MNSSKPRGLYLVEPHGRLIYDGRKTSIAKSKHIPLSGDWVIVSKEQGVGLGYGVAQVGESRVVDIETFDSEFESHRVTLRERTKWWPDATELHLWPIRSFNVYPTPKRVRVPPGTKTIMNEVSYIPDAPGDSPDIEPGQDRERPYTETGRPRDGDSSGELTKNTPSESQEVNMPWTTENPPSCADNWTESEKKKCVTAANAVLRDGGEEQDAIFACIRAAGKTEHPGGESKKTRGEGQGVDGPRQGEGGPEHCICPECGETVAHEPGTPCTEMECPKCGSPMKPKPESDESDDESKKNVHRDHRESDRARAVSGTLTKLRAMFDDDVDITQLTHMAENLVSLKTVDPDTGEDSPQICVCPQCGFTSEQLPNAPCSKMGCPKCGTAMKPQEDMEPPEEPTEEPSSKTVKSSRITKFLDGVITSTKSILGMRDPLMNNALGYKVHESQDGRTWLILSAVNAFQDRDGEIFTTKAINEYVDSQEKKHKKGELWFWHMPGTKFADITWQGVSGRFLYEAGPFDDTVAGKFFKEFFVTHPQGHVAVASRGWGASHGYVYSVEDRKDAVYDWFDKVETSVLPFEYASNPHNAALEVMMNTKQIDALRAIGGDALVDHVTKAGEERTKELEGHVAFKSANANVDDDSTPPEPTESTESTKKYQMNALERRELALDMSEILQLDELSRVVSAQTKVLSQLAEKMKDNDGHMDGLKDTVDTRIAALERSDEEKLAERQLSLPRYAWFRASTAPETTSMARAAEALKERHPGVPGAVSAIVDKLTG